MVAPMQTVGLASHRCNGNFGEGCNKPGHDLLYSGAELRRPYPGYISTTSDHSTQRKDEASEGR